MYQFLFTQTCAVWTRVQEREAELEEAKRFHALLEARPRRQEGQTRWRQRVDGAHEEAGKVRERRLNQLTQAGGELQVPNGKDQHGGGNQGFHEDEQRGDELGSGRPTIGRRRENMVPA